MKIYSKVSNTIKIVSELNFNCNLVFDVVNKLSHSQNKYYDKQAIRNLAKDLSKRQQLSKDKTKEQLLEEEQIKSFTKSSTKGSIER